jgi:hypothetical protein
VLGIDVSIYRVPGGGCSEPRGSVISFDDVPEWIHNPIRTQRVIVHDGGDMRYHGTSGH